jgi:hypothetical protein
MRRCEKLGWVLVAIPIGNRFLIICTVDLNSLGASGDGIAEPDPLKLISERQKPSWNEEDDPSIVLR